MPAVQILAILTAEEPERSPPNVYEMYTSIAALNAPMHRHINRPVRLEMPA